MINVFTGKHTFFMECFLSWPFLPLIEESPTNINNLLKFHKILTINVEIIVNISQSAQKIKFNLLTIHIDCL